MERHIGKLVIVVGAALLILGILGGVFITIEAAQWGAKSQEMTESLAPLRAMTPEELMQALGPQLAGLVSVIVSLGGALELLTSKVDTYLVVVGVTMGAVVGLAGIGMIILGLMLDKLLRRLPKV